ncbi:NERD domain-containing protein/DEAD/DEAH box helicase [Edaphobacter sp.]|uniref:nuclease-related domain-containing DEAD/DEAH box helicase n=1 Tax=Edaphobacter sp. TaxID=1934404 RepID=UPI002DB61CD7|nr:NERD domain-containing protein/DEAD/DEAH box helicase [Edaphobacter sp.]HEU5342411.1 NERD domain-containing protein/DEAD/DEAH box helicase [Edaphobacter sp.]
MAEYIGLGADDPSENSERIVASCLRSLSSQWTVLHHVSWQSLRDGRQGDGEADFLLLHPKKGLIVLEVKGGGIQVENGRWCTTDRYGHVRTIKNPYEQATASKHALVSWLAARGFTGLVRVGHAVVFPHLSTLPVIGPMASPAITLAMPELERIESSIGRCVKHWKLDSTLSEKELRQLVALLAPTIRINRSLAVESGEAEKRVLTLTAEQISVFAGLRAHRGGLIVGGAGTGKTVLAIACALQLARDGFRTLLVCYNELLGNQLSEALKGSERLVVSTFHSLCMREARKAGIPIVPNQDDSWWEVAAPDILLQAIEKNDEHFDAIVVDEAQDFAPLWLDTLRLLLNSPADAPFFVFADLKQDLRQRQSIQEAEYPFVWELTVNLRNTEPIAQKVSQAIGAHITPNGASGPLPSWRFSDHAQGVGPVLDAVEALLDSGFGPHNIVVLCVSASTVASLRSHTIGSYSFGSWKSKGVPVETVHRFKGLESEALVLVLAETDAYSLQVSGYIGMSRARSVLVVVGSQAQQQHLHWIASAAVKSK